MTELKQMMVRLPPGLDQRLTKAAGDVMLPKAALARYLIRQQLDYWDDVSEQEQLDDILIFRRLANKDLPKEDPSKGEPNPNTARKKRKRKR